MKPIKKILGGLFILSGFVALLSLLHAQETAFQVQSVSLETKPDSIVQLTAEAQGLAQVAREDLPRNGTFWLVMPGGGMAPLPCLPGDTSLPVYRIVEEIFLVDASGQVGLSQQAAKSTVASALEAKRMRWWRSSTGVQEAQFGKEFSMAFGLEEEMDSPSGNSPMFASYDPDALYLEITNVTGGLAYLNLVNGTNQVYAIWVTSNLLTGWQVERELWPTNSEVMPFTLPTLGRENLFVRAEDWTGVDSNGDGIPDWWIWQFFGDLSMSATNDFDGDGVNNLQEYLNGTDPTNPDSAPGLLGRWHFDTTNWFGVQGQQPLVATNLNLVPSWSSNAMELNTDDGDLRYKLVEDNGHTNLNLQCGTIRLWFRPNWSSVLQGGIGGNDQNWPTLFEVEASDLSGGFWGAYINPDGTKLWFDSTDGTDGSQSLEASIFWKSNQWHQVAVTYSPSNSAMYVDGVLVSSASGISILPASVLNEFYVGNNVYVLPAHGRFDELDTFDHPLTASRIAADYLAAVNRDSDSNGLPDFWELNNFGHLGVDPNADPDGDGYNNLQEYQMRTDPNVFTANAINFYLSVPNQYVNTNHINASVTVLDGTPFYYAVLVDSTDFSNATWTAYTSSNIAVNFGSAEGRYSVWVGLRGLPEGAKQTWQEMTFTLDKTPPEIVVTNPVASTVSQPVIQVQGLAGEQLSSLKFDVSNATGIFPNQTGYLTGQVYDTNLLAFTTHYFQCYDVRLTNGPNAITLHAADLAGNVTTTSLTVTLDYSGDTTPPGMQLVWPQAGALISGSDFNLQAQTDDLTAQVMVMIVDSFGDTNTVRGSVKRDGTVRAQNLPLASGTNTITVTATDAAGNASMTNFTVVQSAVLLTINPLATGQLNKASVSVSGTVSDPTKIVTVNGVQATVAAGGSWSAANVPVSISGMAEFSVLVYPNGSDTSSTPPDGGQHSNQLQPPTIGILSNDSGDDFWQSIHSTNYWYCTDYPCNSENRTNVIYQDCRQLDLAYEQTYWVAGQGGFRLRTSQNPNLCSEPPRLEFSLNKLSTNYYAGRWPGTFFEYREAESTDLDNPWTLFAWDRDCFSINAGESEVGATRMYLVAALMEDGYGDLSNEWFTICGQTLTSATNAARLALGYMIPDVFGQTIVTVPAGVNHFDVTPVGGAALRSFQLAEQADGPYVYQQVYYRFHMAVQPIGLTTLETRDRLVHGVIDSANGDIVNVTIKNQPNGEGASAQELGTFYDLFGNNPEGTPLHQTYNNADDILSDTEVAAMDNGTYGFGSQKVIFVRDPANPKRLHFYTVADDYGKLTVNVDGKIGSMMYSNSITQPLERDNLGQFGDVITYLDQRIGSPELVSVPTTGIGETPPPIQQSSLLTKTLITYFKVNINAPFALTRGGIDGFWGGMKSDYDGLAGLSSLAGRFTASSAERAAVIKELRSITWSGIYNQMANGLTSFMDEAEQNAVLVNFGQASPAADDFVARVYVDGYAMGFTTEQIVAMSLGASAASKVGLMSKTVISSVKGGQYVVAGVTAIAKFKTRAVEWVISAAKNNVVTETVAKTAGTMVETVANLPTTINGKKVGQIIGEKVESAGALYDELRLIGKPLDDFGVKAHARLADLLGNVFGTSLSEAEMRGFLRVYSRLEYGTGDYYDKLTTVFRTESAAGKQRLRTALAAFADPASVPDKDLLTLVYVAKKDVDAAEHPALVAFKQRAEELAPEVGQPLRNYEGIAAARYEIQTGHTGLYRPTASDIPDAGLRVRVDYVDPSTSGSYIDVKGPILTSAGEFDETVTIARIEGLADSAVQKAQINNGLVPQSAGGLNPPLPTTVVVDLFGLTEAEASVVKTKIQNSGVAEAYFIILEN